MIQALGGVSSCIISYDKKSGTYNLIHHGQVINQRALIWEGVSLRTAESKQAEAQAALREKNEQEKEYKINGNIEKDKRYTDIISLIPSELKNKLKNAGHLQEFIIQNEKRLDWIIKEQKKKGRELENSEPISRIHFGSGLMEAHFINTEGTKNDITIWNETSKSMLSTQLYDILDGNEGNYKTFLASRIKQKRSQADHLTKRENQFENKESKAKVSGQSLINFKYGLTLFSTFINQIESEDGTSHEIAALKKKVRDYLYSLETGTPSWGERAKAIEGIGDLFVKYKSNDWNRSRVSDKEARECIKWIFIGNKTTAETKLRELGVKLNIWGNTKTSFIADEVIENGGIQVEETVYNTAFQNIQAKLDIKENDSKIKGKAQFIDALYGHNQNSETIFTFLKNQGLLPKNAQFNNDEIKKMMGKDF